MRSGASRDLAPACSKSSGLASLAGPIPSHKPLRGSRDQRSRLQRASHIGTRLADPVSLVGVDRINIRLIHETAQVDIVAEIGGCDRLVLVSANPLLIGLVHFATAVDVGGQEAKRDVAMLLAVAVNVLDPQRDHFCTGHSSQLCGHTVTTEGNRTNRSGPTDIQNLSGSDCLIEVED